MKLLSISRVLNAPIGEVWAVTSAFGAIRAWMPGVARVSLIGAGVGAERTVSGAMGNAVERITELDAERHLIRYSVDIAGLEFLKNLSGHTALEPLAADRTKLTWAIEVAEGVGDTAALLPGFSRFVDESIEGLARFLGVAVEQ